MQAGEKEATGGDGSAVSQLGAQGPFAGLLDGFRPRDSQQAMAARIEQAIAARETLIAESGTGTGKTLAYLVPALLSGRRVLISTGTRHLQDQLYHNDLPLVRTALEIPATVALLKGRSNYLCRQRFDDTCSGSGGRRQRGEMAIIRDWAGVTHSGDISEVSGVPEQSLVWLDVTSTPDNCLGSKCHYYDDCYVNLARRDALEADVVVVNHHLFLADLVLREEGFGQLLPGVEVVIFDEAHQLPETASLFFSTVVSQRQLIDLARDTRAAEAVEKSGVGGLELRAERVETLARELRLAMGQGGRRGDWRELDRQAGFAAGLAAVARGLVELDEALEVAAPAGERLAHCRERTATLQQRLQRFSVDDRDSVRWYETSDVGFRCHVTPLTVASRFREQVCESDRALVFTSATLAVAGRFDHFQRQLGLEEAATCLYPSPFDYPRQALFYLPRALPSPNQPAHTARVIEVARTLLPLSGGRAFLLFTSFQALNEAAAQLAGQLAYPVLVQGTAPRHRLLEEFRRLGNAVLLGTGSFWEGVDVKGDALSLVLIDKLPFAAPDDPVLQARSRVLRESGENPFMSYSLPQAVTALRQGAGRLIRDVHDRGVLVVCDPRLAEKSYGRVFVESLPPMRRTRDHDEVVRFFAAATPEAGIDPVAHD